MYHLVIDSRFAWWGMYALRVKGGQIIQPEELSHKAANSDQARQYVAIISYNVQGLMQPLQPLDQSDMMPNHATGASDNLIMKGESLKFQLASYSKPCTATRANTYIL